MVLPTIIVGGHSIIKKSEKMVIKTFDTRGIFLRELLIYKILSTHPYIPTLMMDNFDCDNSICMECMDGDVINLFSESINDRVILTNTMISNVGSAINYMKSIGISHCDIKPSNIFYKRYGDNIGSTRFKIADFSYSRTRGSYKSLYTPQYRAVEMLLGIGGDSYFSDIWAFGISCLDLLIGGRIINTDKVEDILVFLFQNRENYDMDGQLFFDSINDSNFADVQNHRLNVRNLVIVDNSIPHLSTLLDKIQNMLYFIPNKRFIRKDIEFSRKTKLLMNHEDDSSSVPNYVESFLSSNIQQNEENFKLIMLNIKDGLYNQFGDDLDDGEIWALSIYLSSLLSDKIININYIIQYIMKSEMGGWIDRSIILSKLKYLGSRFFDCIDV